MKNEKSSNLFSELKAEFQAHKQLLKPKEEYSDAEYSETIYSPSWMRLPVYGFFVILILFFLFSPLWNEDPDNVTNLLLCLAFTICLLFFKTFFTLKVTLFPDKIRFGYYHSTVEANYASILSCEIYRDDSTSYLSLGAKDGWDGSIQYTIPGDQIYAVKIIVKDEKKNRKQAYIFNSKRPEVIQKIIQARLNSSSPETATSEEKD